jgi:hypothetical protein
MISKGALEELSQFDCAKIGERMFRSIRNAEINHFACGDPNAEGMQYRDCSKNGVIGRIRFYIKMRRTCCFVDILASDSKRDAAKAISD